MSKIRVTVWNEFQHEKESDVVANLYPNGIHQAIADFLNQETDMEAKGATLEMAEHGLTDEVLDKTDVLLWWAHKAHDQVDDAIAGKVQSRVLDGMGVIFLHSAHFSKPFRRLLGTSGVLHWREAAEKERLWNIEPGHPITQGIGPYFELSQTEMYGERFDIPTPDKLIFISWFQGGEVFRSGCCWERGHGRMFYFRPGHETYPIYSDSNVQRVIVNAVRWANPRLIQAQQVENSAPIEPLD